VPVATVVVRDGYVLPPETLAAHVEKRLDRNLRPRFVHKQASIEMSVGFRPMKKLLRDQGIDARDIETLHYDVEKHRYEAGSV